MISLYMKSKINPVVYRFVVYIVWPQTTSPISSTISHLLAHWAPDLPLPLCFQNSLCAVNVRAFALAISTAFPQTFSRFTPSSSKSSLQGFPYLTSFRIPVSILQFSLLYFVGKLFPSTSLQPTCCLRTRNKRYRFYHQTTKH